MPPTVKAKSRDTNRHRECDVNYSNKNFELDRTGQLDVIRFKKTGHHLTLAPGELDEFFRFLCPLYEDILLPAERVYNQSQITEQV
jgi:hypothetical protein